MLSVDLQVLNALNQWCEQGHTAWLATVVRTWGSAPRPVGSLMGIRGDGQVVGSVSGGCIEDDLIRQLGTGALHSVLPTILTYGAAADQARRFSLPCGGTLQIVLELVDTQSKLDTLVDHIRQRRLVQRELDLQSGEARLELTVMPTPFRFDGLSLAATFGPRYRLLLIGAGQVAHYLASMALALDYHVIVCEPREEYRHSWTIHEAEIRTDMPDDLILELQVDTATAVVALTHDPKLDDMALLEALTSDAFYVGAIGSHRNNETRKARMMQYFDLSEAQVGRLRGPVGLSIGALTPPEIAVSILAEMIAARRGAAIQQRRPAALWQEHWQNGASAEAGVCPLQREATLALADSGRERAVSATMQPSR
ncbi:MAG: XdhC family protein [Pigmentiphaga sp.]